MFLLRYVSESEFGQTIQAETTKVESYNDFTDWIMFGGEIIKSGDPKEQTKQINKLGRQFDYVAKCDRSNGCNAKDGDEGYIIKKEFVASLSPYLRDHIGRFGRYEIDINDHPPNLRPNPVSVTDN